ncbi:MAG: hypothetical protein J6B77_00430, partial [Clostridia bacterium]|nr:hypothetical protein [Clostridia bacterium]
VNKSVLAEAITIQMTWPGAPTIYYADEAGQVGFTDPDSRRTYPWGKEDLSLIDLHRALTSLRTAYPVLKNGSLLPLSAAYGCISYARFNEQTGDVAVVAINNTAETRTLRLPVWETGLGKDAALTEVFRSSEDGLLLSSECCLHLENGVKHRNADAVRAEHGYLTLSLPPFCASIFVTN